MVDRSMSTPPYDPPPRDAPSVPFTPVRRPASPWAAAPEPAEERATGRLRRVVQGLPAWEPLPPGESTVRRPGAGR
jgi:hypothetical protein